MIQKLSKFIILVLPLWCGILVKGLQDLDFKENDVTLIVPQVAVVNSDVSMECRFNPKGTSIYSVKWYKGEGAEFFRFSPKERPEKKFFEIPGLEKLVVVDMNHSDMNKIYLRGIPMKLTGNISCEVTPEPSFKPIQKYQFITVIAPPETPTLEILPKLPQNFQPRNNPLTLICKVGPSKPVANITFYINNSPYIPEKHQVKSVPFMDDDKDKYKGFQAREAQLNITLTSEHFNESKVEIHCGASIYNITRNSDKYETQQINSPKQFSYKHDSNSSGQGGSNGPSVLPTTIPIPVDSSIPHNFVPVVTPFFNPSGNVIWSLANSVLLFGLQLFLSQSTLFWRF